MNIDDVGNNIDVHDLYSFPTPLAFRQQTSLSLNTSITHVYMPL